MPFVVQNMFILVAPVLFAASIYMTLGRIIASVGGDRHSLVRPSKITLTFVLGDVVSFVVQGGGAGLSVVQKEGFAKWAERIIVIGLLIQIIMFALFCVLAVVFHRRMRRAPTAASYPAKLSWESGLYMLYGVSFLIMVRSIFRVIEYAQGQTGYALSHEWTLYVFDSLLMFAVTAIFAWRFPSDFNHGHGAPSESVEMGI
jgi:heme/copper-type cytochrome/quinol oxidase subunit 2